MIEKFLPDAYEMRARIAPVIIVALPAIFTTLKEIFDVSGWENITITGIVAITLLTLLAQLGRSRGKAIEHKLFRQWGGKPTTVLLRHHNTQIDVKTKRRLHKILNSNIEDIQIPTLQEETEAPVEADNIYDSAVYWLRSNTSDKKKFDRLHEENISYGFRRNLLGLKPFGLIISAASVGIDLFMEQPFSRTQLSKFVVRADTLIAFSLVLFLLVVVKSLWVKQAAYNYAHALLNAVEKIDIGE
jgi:hypothetical protein